MHFNMMSSNKKVSSQPGRQFKQMAKYRHLTTLSTDSKMALESGNITKMMSHSNKLHKLFKQCTPYTKGPSHRHLIGMKNAVEKFISLNCKPRDDGINSKSDTNLPQPGPFQDFFTECDNSQETSDDTKPLSFKSETLSSRKMIGRKNQSLSTRKKLKADDSLKETIYKHYYEKLTKLTKMRASPIGPSYLDRTKTRSTGFSPEYDTQSYEDKFRNLMYKVKIKWRPRDYIQRTFKFKSLFHRLCTNIMDCIKNCISAVGHRLDSMDRLDNLFRILRRFKVSSPVFRQKRVHKGGGPKKKVKTVGSGDESHMSHPIGIERLSVPVVDTLSRVLRVQFKQQYGLLNVSRLHKASRTSGPVTQILKKCDLNPVPDDKHAVQIHFCKNHYVTSEQKSSHIVVYDSLQTDNDFKVDLYPQLRYTYQRLNCYSTPPEDLIIYTTPQQQEDSTSCGIFAVLRAYFILSNKSYTFNQDIGRSYLSSVLEKNIFSNYDCFTSNYIIREYVFF